MEKQAVLDQLTVREISIAERKSGIPMTALEDPNAIGKFDLLSAIAWVWQKRDDALVTYEDVQNSTLEELLDVLGITADESE